MCLVSVYCFVCFWWFYIVLSKQGLGGSRASVSGTNASCGSQWAQTEGKCISQKILLILDAYVKQSAKKVTPKRAWVLGKCSKSFLRNHNSEATINYFEKHNLKFSELPSQSSALNIIDNLTVARCYTCCDSLKISRRGQRIQLNKTIKSKLRKTDIHFLHTMRILLKKIICSDIIYQQNSINYV